jgi:IclR family transcriptional regulator, acetate operon repressor
MDVKTAGRTLEIFETFANSQAPMSLSEISRALEAPLSSCLYIVRALEERGYLYGVGVRKHIYPTRKLLDLGRSIADGEPWIEQMEPRLEALRDIAGETVILGKRLGSRAVYLAVFEGVQNIRYSSKVGDVKPLHSSSIGKAILSSLPEDDRKKLVSKLKLEAITQSTLTTQKALLEDLAHSEKRGYAVTRGENVADVMAIARCISIGEETYGLAIAGPLYRMIDTEKKLVGHLLRASKDIEGLA